MGKNQNMKTGQFPGQEKDRSESVIGIPSVRHHHYTSSSFLDNWV
jgi:hypothetical protein